MAFGESSMAFGEVWMALRISEVARRVKDNSIDVTRVAHHVREVGVDLELAHIGEGGVLHVDRRREQPEDPHEVNGQGGRRRCELTMHAAWGGVLQRQRQARSKEWVLIGASSGGNARRGGRVLCLGEDMLSACKLHVARCASLKMYGQAPGDVRHHDS